MKRFLKKDYIIKMCIAVSLLILVIVLISVFTKKHNSRYVDISETGAPISDGIGSLPAKYYVMYTHSESSSVFPLTACRFVGNGMINLDGYLPDSSNDLSDYLSVVPDYQPYINSDYDVLWVKIIKSCGQFFVIGELYPHKKAANGSLDIEIQEYIASAESIVASYNPPVTYYFSSSGNDKNSGLSPDSPKLNPTDYLRKGNCTVLFKSGDIITLNWPTAVGSNVKISTYDGSERAILDATTVNSAPFLTYDSENNVYYSELDYINNAHLNIAYLIYDGVSDVDWHRVFDYNELLQDGDFYVDKENRVLYIKSYRDLSGKVFAYGNGAGGLNFKDGSNGLVENIEIVGCGNGVYVNRYSNFVCRGCYIHHVGGIDSTAKDGTPFRYGNGITFWTNDVHNAYAYDNVVFDCFDAGISPQISGSGTKSSDNIKIFNNYVSRCLYTLECFQSLQTAETYDIVIANNLLSDAIDITNGYRHTLSNSNALFRMGTSTSDKTKMFIHDNFGISSYGYAYSFYADSPDGVYDMDDNTLVLVNTNSVEDAIKNPQFYDGSEEDIITIDYGTNEYQQYLQDFYERASAFDISSHYFDIIWSRIISTEEALSEIYDFSSEVDSWENNTEENDLESITVNDSNGSLSDENVSSSDSEEVPATSENQQDSIENNGE